MFIDFHTHAFPDKIAAAALSKLSYAAGALTAYQDGTLQTLRDTMKRLDGRCVLLPIATRPAQQTSINQFAAQAADARIFSFGSVHPDAPDVLEELERIHALGLRGIKLHPEYQGFFIGEPRMKRVYQKAARLGLITIFHAGMDLAYPPPCHCTPGALKKILPWFDGAPVVAAHFGGYLFWDDVLKTLMGLPIYLDTSYSHGHIVKPYAQQIIERHGAQNILFGSDSPWNAIEDELAFIHSLGLSEHETEAILHKNAERLLGIGEQA